MNLGSHVYRFSLLCCGCGLFAAIAGWSLGGNDEPKASLPGSIPGRIAGGAVEHPGQVRACEAPDSVHASPFDASSAAEPNTVGNAALPVEGQTQASSPLPPTSASPVVTQVDPAIPGNHIRVVNQFVTVEHHVSDPLGRPPQLGVAIYPLEEADVSGAVDSTRPGQVPADPRVLQPGFSYEDELFRAKWGWGAYNAAHRAATWELNQATP